MTRANSERHGVTPSTSGALVRAHRLADFRARVDATSMAEAELQSTPAQLTFVARGWTVGVSAESAK
jgi:hypothetical protein